ncbi:MAG: 4-alpha-glucanotransferase [Rhabdochlamydiaceae bacterium]|nr:4-alpha-glucanotransferase [Rhabdochlamydiaceae bacterium]
MTDSLEKHFLYSPLETAWQRIGLFSHRGINLPLSALHSENSTGIGDFFDLLPLIDWCASLSMDVIQLLPLNDSGLDPSPYNALSSCALHPIYICLQKLPFLMLNEDQDLLSRIENLKKLNRSARVCFQDVLLQKMDFFSLYFEKHEKEILEIPAFSQFLLENPWLRPYSLFKVLKEKNKGTLFSSWPQKWTQNLESSFGALFEEHQKQCLFHIALQYLCFSQMQEVKKKSVEKKIHLKGDIPILISADSADVWFHQSCFDKNFAIGAPPDHYNQEGQYWGFPLPRWDIMRQDGFFWWKQRLQYAENFYDLYRIDHVIGLFRLWTIPLGKQSKEGFFTPADSSLWEPLGRELLQTFIQASNMLPIAEDLGMVPPMTRPVLENLGICGTKVMRWEKDAPNHFIDPKSYKPLSLTCVSTHDSTLLSQWWIEEEQEAKNYAEQEGIAYTHSLTQEQRRHILKKSMHSGSLFHINLLSEYLALVPDLVHPNPQEERINIPGVVLSTNWTYKFRCSTEEMISHSGLFEEMKNLLI